MIQHIYSPQKEKELIVSFSEESLFRYVYRQDKFFSGMEDLKNRHIWFTDLWQESKLMIKTILNEKYPEMVWKSTIDNFVESIYGQSSVKVLNNSGDVVESTRYISREYQEVIRHHIELCLIYMTLFHVFFNKEEKYRALLDDIFKKDLPDNQMRNLRKFTDVITNGIVKNDYNYAFDENNQSAIVAQSETGEQTQMPACSFQVENTPDDEEDGLDLPSRLAIAFVLRGMGINSKPDGGKQEALIRILMKVTKVSRKKCRDFLNDFSLKISHNGEELKKFNDDLEKLGLPLLTTSLESE